MTAPVNTFLFRSVEKLLPPGSQLVKKKIYKNNGVMKEAFSLLCEEGAAPLVYPEDFIGPDPSEEELFSAAKKIAEILMTARPDCSIGSFLDDPDRVKSRIAFRLMPEKGNEALLETLVYRPWLDLALGYQICFDGEITGQGVAAVTKAAAGMLETDEEELFRLASVNTPLLFKPRVTPMEELLDLPLDESAPLYVLTNAGGFFGASCMPCTEQLRKLSDQLGHDLIVLPSSVHELLLLPYTGTENPRELRAIVRSVNAEISAEDVLSENVYLFERYRETFSIL